MDLLTWSALAAAIGVAVPIAVFALESFTAAILGHNAKDLRIVSASPPPSTKVLIPAHDEERGLEKTLLSLFTSPRLPRSDVLVVAHNCSDRTARIARAHEVRVLEVEDGGTGGKPDALAAGMKELAADPPEVVVTLDADCSVSADSIEILASVAHHCGRPVQGPYLFARSSDGASLGSVSELALLFKNYIRPLGLHHLGLPCLLNGSGSAFPFALLQEALRKEGGIVEDRVYSIDLALAGYPTRFCPPAHVWSALPEGSKSALAQRRRWEHGNLNLLLTRGPQLIATGLLRARPALLFLGLDLLVPPLALLALAWGGAALLAGAAAWFGGASVPLWLTAITGALFFLAVVTGSGRFQGVGKTARLLITIPLYVLWKVPLYATYILRREKRWIRTSRSGVAPEEKPGDGGRE